MIRKTREDLLNYISTKSVDINLLPHHIAVIMDGNGRWAVNKGLPRIIGHKNGYRVFHDTIQYASDMGVKHLTLYAFSTENWKRPTEEVDTIFSIMLKVAKREIAFAHENNVRVRIIGNKDQLNENLRKTLLDVESQTECYDGLQLYIAINYGGRAEILDGCKKIIQKGIHPEDITEDLFSEYLYSPCMPNVDLMIRTSGEMRWSNFLIWQAAYAEFYSTDVTWPDFTLDDFLESIKVYQARDRRFGKLKK